MSSDGGLRPLFHSSLRVGMHWQSVETGGTGRGIPDSNFCALTERDDGSPCGCEGWVEFKQTAAWSVRLSPEQIGWHLARYMRGGRTFVAVRRQHPGGPRRGPPEDQLWLYQGTAAPALGRSGLRTTDGLLGRWEGGPIRWDWDRVRELLVSHP